MKNLSYINPKGELKVDSNMFKQNNTYLIDGIQTCELFADSLAVQDYKNVVILVDTNIRLDWFIKH